MGLALPSQSPGQGLGPEATELAAMLNVSGCATSCSWAPPRLPLSLRVASLHGTGQGLKSTGQQMYIYGAAEAPHDPLPYHSGEADGRRLL